MEKIKVHVTKRKRKRGYVYSVVWQDPRTGQHKTESVGKDRAYAYTVASERRRMLQEGRTAGITSITYDDFVTEHLCEIEGQLSEGSYREHARVLRQFRKACNPKRLTVIDYAMLQRFRAARIKDGVAPTTVNKGLRTLQGILERAVMRNYLTVNPFQGKRKALWTKEPEKAVNFMPKEEFEALLGACQDDRWRAICIVAYHAGLRRGELVFLAWQDVDFGSRELYVRNKDDHSTKSRKNRTVPMNSNVVKSLGTLRSGKFPGGDVFRNVEGRKMLNNFNSCFERIVKRAGLVNEEGKAAFSIHDLRRSCCTNLLAQGVSPKMVQEIMGHVNIETTMKYYAGVTNKGKHEAMRRLESGA